jgi:hypothetical protein
MSRKGRCGRFLHRPQASCEFRADFECRAGGSCRIAPLVSLTIARHMSNHWRARMIWDRVISNYNRDSDIFLLGIGYCWQ